MVEPQGMQERGLKVVDGHDTVDRLVAKVVGRAVDIAGA